jgi:sporulation protein YlmC with PRC-barrel domain
VRLAELAGARLIDSTGRDVATVHDLRLSQDGPVHEATARAAYRVRGLVVGPGHVGLHMGYGGREVVGPALLSGPLGRLAKRARLVDWSLIEELSPGRVRISCAYDDLPSAGEPGERAT